MQQRLRCKTLKVLVLVAPFLLPLFLRSRKRSMQRQLPPCLQVPRPHHLRLRQLQSHRTPLQPTVLLRPLMNRLPLWLHRLGGKRESTRMVRGNFAEYSNILKLSMLKGTGNCDGAVNGTNGKPILIPCQCPPDQTNYIVVRCSFYI